MDFCVSGPVLRGSGVNYDVRKNDPYLIYPEIKFDAIVENGGDCFARYKVRVREIHESIKIIRQAIAQIPDGPFNMHPGYIPAKNGEILDAQSSTQRSFYSL